MLITTAAIAEAIDTAPAWAKIALTVSSPRLREDARAEMARHVYDSLYRAVDTDTEQLPLPL